MKCAKCGTENRPGDFSCAKCHGPLPRTSSVPHRGAPKTTPVEDTPEVIEFSPPQAERNEPTERLDLTAFRAKLKAAVTRPPAPSAPPRPPEKPSAKPSAPPRAWLHCEPLASIPVVDGREVKIGRDKSCELVLPHSSVSRHHATIKVSGQDLVLEHRGGANGTLLNGKHVTVTNVRIGDTIQVGPYQIDLWAVPDLPDAGATHTVPVPSAASDSKYTVFEAKLPDTNVRDFLRDIEAKKRTGTLRVADGQRKGQIVFFEGRPIMAAWAGQGGDDAALAMLDLTVGAIAFSTQVDPRELQLDDDAEPLKTITELLAPPPPKPAPKK